ncbi:hypothetical protein MHU86_18774 [Fragilaria crotonensis]|nr:hypothetical protein MHU86_18774 [Fragilaria crotonensis]
MTTPTRLEDVDISTLVDIGLPTDLLNAITTAQLDLASISIERESMEAERAAERVQTAINFETERALPRTDAFGVSKKLLVPSQAKGLTPPPLQPTNFLQQLAPTRTLSGPIFQKIALIST